MLAFDCIANNKLNYEVYLVMLGEAFSSMIGVTNQHIMYIIGLTIMWSMR